MAQANQKKVEQLLNNAVLLYGMWKGSEKIAMPFELDDHGNLPSSLVDQYGNPFGLRIINNKPIVSAQPYTYDIAKGNVPGREPWHVLGANADIDNVEETLWAVGGVYVPPTTPMQMEIVSTSLQDSGAGGVNPAGTGIRTVDIHYLDGTFAEHVETVTLDGTTVVTTTATDIYRIISFHTKTTGTSKAAVGTIDLRNLANTPIYAEIVVGKNEAVQSFTTIPAGKTAYLTSCLGGAGNILGGRFVRFIMSLTQDPDAAYTNGIWYDYGYAAVQDGSVSHRFDTPFKINSGVDFRVNAISDSATSNALVAVMCSGWIEEN